jgi:hypothetical protein
MNATNNTRKCDNNVVVGNIFIGSATNDTTDFTTQNIVNITDQRRGRFANNYVGRLFATVVGNQTVGAGGTLIVENLEGWTNMGTGTIYNKGTGNAYAYTAISSPASSTDTSTITLTAGGTFSDGDVVYVGAVQDAINIIRSFDFAVNDNTIFLAPGNAITFATNNFRCRALNNKIIQPASQVITNRTYGISLDGSNTDMEIKGNHIIDETGSATATRGVNVATGETRVVLMDNLVDGIATAYNVGTPANVLIDRRNRTSYTAVPNGGVATVNSPATSASTSTIAHGLTTTPTLFTVQPGNAAAQGAPSMYVTAGATNLTLNFASSLTTSTAYVWNWTAEV